MMKSSKFKYARLIFAIGPTVPDFAVQATRLSLTLIRLERELLARFCTATTYARVVGRTGRQVGLERYVSIYLFVCCSIG